MLGVANKTIILSAVMLSVVALKKKIFADCSTDPAWTSIHRSHLVVPLLQVTPT
jgi:hypothetical protein